MGTEKIWVGDPGWLITLGSRAAIQLHLPIIDVMMSRSSWKLAQQQVKIAAGPYADKQMLRDIKSDKPFLLMDYDADPLSPDQRYLLEASDYIGEFSSCRVYACYPARIVANDKKHADDIAGFLLNMDVGDTRAFCTSSCYLEHYGAFDRDAFWGRRSLPRIAGNDSVVATIPIHIGPDSVLYEFSCWFLLSILSLATS